MCETDRPHQSSAKVKNAWKCTLISPYVRFQDLTPARMITTVFSDFAYDVVDMCCDRNLQTC